MPKYTKENRSWVINAAHKQESPLCECRKGFLYITSWTRVNTAMLSTKVDTIPRNIVWQAWNLSATLQEGWGPAQESLDEHEKHLRSQNFSFQPPSSRYSPFHENSLLLACCQFVSDWSDSLCWLKGGVRNGGAVGLPSLLPVWSWKGDAGCMTRFI